MKLEDVICVMEIKVIVGNKRKKSGDTQDEKGDGKRVFEVGLIFDRSARNLVSFAWCEMANSIHHTKEPEGD